MAVRSKRRTQSPFATVAPKGAPAWVRFDLGSLLLVMFVSCAMGAAIFYASRVPIIQREFYSYLGYVTPPSSAPNSRISHLNFLLFCYASPLLLTGVLGILVSLLRWATQFANPLEDEDEPLWENEPVIAVQAESIPQQFRVTKQRGDSLNENF